MIRRLLLLVATVAVLTGCRVDIAVDVEMTQNGSGTLTLTAVADQAVVEAAPDLADDLRLDDLRTAGWSVDEPVPTADGGLAITLRHAFDTPEQATALMASLSGPDGPFDTVSFARTATERAVTVTMSGSAGLDAGLASFADADLLAVAGAEPYADRIREAGVTADDAVAISLAARLPGEVESTTGTEGFGGPLDAEAPSVLGPVLTWTIPTDGTRADLATTTRTSLERGGIWPVLSTVALVLLIAWLVASVVLIGLVSRRQVRRRRRARRVTPSA